MLTQLVTLLKFAETKRVEARVEFTNSLYSDHRDSDWLPEYFEVNGMPGGGQRFKVHNDWDYKLMGADTFINLAEAHDIFQRRVRFAPHVEQLLGDVLAAADAPRRMLGVHYRGTDKHYEAVTVAPAEMLAAVRAEFDLGTHDKIFLATDEPSFQSRMLEVFGAERIMTYSHPGLAPVEGEPIHFSKASGRAKALDAIRNIRLLAQCDSIIRTASYMSGWAKVINPRQRVKMLNKLSTSSHKFPDTEIAELMQASGGEFAV